MLNIMRDVPRADTQPIGHARLLLCMFVPFFSLGDLRAEDETWPTAHIRAEEMEMWDARTKPFRLNIAGMLSQRLDADEESARKRTQDTSKSSANGHNELDDVFNHDYDDDNDGTASVIPTSSKRLAVDSYVGDALHRFVQAGFIRDNSLPEEPPLPLSGRTPTEYHADIDHIIEGSSPSAAAIDIVRQETVLKQRADDGDSATSHLLQPN